MNTCRACKFFRQVNERGGECFRFPPQIFYEPANNPLTQQPVMVKRGALPPVPVDFYCGEFSPRVQLQS